MTMTVVDDSSVLTIAVPKGRLLPKVASLLGRVGLNVEVVDEASRRLIFDDPCGSVRYILTKPTDVPILVEYGAADVGFAGKDVLAEEGKDVCELLALSIGCCKMIVAAPEDGGPKCLADLHFNSRVATKYPRVATAFFNSRGIQAEVIKMNGNIELAPMVGLADIIVDITETGTTLRENGLIEIARVFEVSTRLIANRISYKLEFEQIRRIVDKLSGVSG